MSSTFLDEKIGTLNFPLNCGKIEIVFCKISWELWQNTVNYVIYPKKVKFLKLKIELVLCLKVQLQSSSNYSTEIKCRLVGTNAPSIFDSM